MCSVGDYIIIIGICITLTGCGWCRLHTCSDIVSLQKNIILSMGVQEQLHDAAAELLQRPRALVEIEDKLIPNCRDVMTYDLRRDEYRSVYAGCITSEQANVSDQPFFSTPSTSAALVKLVSLPAGLA